MSQNLQSSPQKSKKPILVAIGTAGIVIIALAIIIGISFRAKPIEKLNATELLERGEEAMQSEDYMQAVLCFNRLIEQDPKNSRAYTQLAQAYIVNDEFEYAITVLRNGFVQLSEDRNFLEQAAKLYERIIAKDSGNAQAHIQLSNVSAALGNDDEAKDSSVQGADRIDDEVPLPGETDNASAQADWKALYLKLFLEVYRYVEESDLSNRIENEPYPPFVTEIQLADLNFDGTPELLIFGDGEGENNRVWIYTIDDTKVHRIFRGWGDSRSIELYVSAEDASLAYVFVSHYENDVDEEGKIYITNSQTDLRDFENSAIALSYSRETEYIYDPDSDEPHIISSETSVNGELVSFVYFYDLCRTLLEDFVETYKEPAFFYWYFDNGPAEKIEEAALQHFMEFLDSYVPEL